MGAGEKPGSGQGTQLQILKKQGAVVKMKERMEKGQSLGMVKRKSW
jgi:hypothetical protein